MRAHLVDGTFELFRTWFGAPPAQVAGREVGATRGLVRSLAAWLRSGEVTHIGVAFDHVIESFRNELFPGYKTGEGVEPALMAQFELAERAVAALGVAMWPMVEFEADDGLATAAARLANDPAFEQIVIASPDKDLAQCVRGTRVVTLDRIRNATRDEAGVIAKFGIGPASIPDYLALVGDDADGIPGIARWGARSAATVLAHYLHVDAIPDEAARWQVTVRGAAALAGELAAHRADALLYRTLATLRTDAPIDASPAAIAWRGADAPALAAVCEELGIAPASLNLPTR
ncbi:MAG: flap endonuclease [Deltaproteobacteria bacterium]|nr:flap endonuclease [Deltaproteobacteria bacterium]